MWIGRARRSRLDRVARGAAPELELPGPAFGFELGLELRAAVDLVSSHGERGFGDQLVEHRFGARGAAAAGNAGPFGDRIIGGGPAARPWEGGYGAALDERG